MLYFILGVMCVFYSLNGQAWHFYQEGAAALFFFTRLGSEGVFINP